VTEISSTRLASSIQKRIVTSDEHRAIVLPFRTVSGVGPCVYHIAVRCRAAGVVAGNATRWCVIDVRATGPAADASCKKTMLVAACLLACFHAGLRGVWISAVRGPDTADPDSYPCISTNAAAAAAVVVATITHHVSACSGRAASRESRAVFVSQISLHLTFSQLTSFRLNWVALKRLSLPWLQPIASLQFNQ